MVVPDQLANELIDVEVKLGEVLDLGPECLGELAVMVDEEDLEDFV